MLTHLILTATLWGKYLYPHFSEEHMEASSIKYLTKDHTTSKRGIQITSLTPKFIHLTTIHIHNYGEMYLGFKMLLILQPRVLKGFMSTSDHAALFRQILTEL